MELDYFSASSLRTIRRCPFKFWCGKTKKPKVVTPNKGRDFGSCVHNAIHDYYTTYQNSIKEMGEIQAKFYDKIMKHWVQFILDGKEKDRDTAHRNFCKFEYDRVNNNPDNLPVITEQRIQIGKRLGIVDYFHNGKLIDWKTGKFEFDTDMIIQGKYYELLMPEAKDVEFFILTDGRRLPLPYVDISFIEKIEKEALEIIATDNFEKKPGWYCNWCDFQLYCEMDGVKLRQII